MVAGTGGLCHDGANSVAYAPMVSENDTVKVMLDFDEKTIMFAKNGVCYGVAFTNLKGTVYPAVSFTGKNSVVQLKIPNVQPSIPLTATVDGNVYYDWDLSGWDPQYCSETMVVENLKAPTIVKNNGSDDKWQCARSKTIFSEGRSYFEFHIIADSKTTNTWRFCLGAVPVSFDVRSKQKKWVGSQGSWGFAAVGETCNDAVSGLKYGQNYRQDDVIGVSLDFPAKTIEYFINGRSQGIAFRNLVGPVYAGCSLTGTASKVYLRIRKAVVPLSGSIAAPIAAPIAASNVFPQVAPVLDSREPLSWDPSNCSTFLQIDAKQPYLFRNNGSADKWQVVLSKQMFSSGKVTVDLEVCLPKTQTSNTWIFCIGVVPVSFSASNTQKWIGSQGSWGYIGGTGGVVHDSVESTAYYQPYTFGDTISVILDFGAKSISFAKNGISPGVAFRNLTGPVKIGASVTATGTALKIRYPPEAFPLAKLIANPSANLPVDTASSNPSFSELEIEYTGVLFVLLDRQRITPDDNRMLTKWRQSHAGYTNDMHLRVLTKLGSSKQKFESMFTTGEEIRKDDECLICMDQVSTIVCSFRLLILGYRLFVHVVI